MGSPVDQAGLFLLQFIAGLVIFVLVLRFLIRATYTDWRNPIVMFIAKVTNPVCKPFAILLPSRGRWDYAALGAAFSVQVIFILLVSWLSARDFGLAFILLSALTEVFNVLLDMGDVLTGLIAGLVTQGFNLFEAAQRGVELHARAGDKVAQNRGESSLLPSDIIDVL